MTATIFLSILFLICFGLYYASIKGDPITVKQTENHVPFYILLILGAALRIVIAAMSKGYEVDMSTFKAWGSYATSLGLNNLYFSDFFLDYPPGYMYVLYVLDTLRGWFGLAYDSAAYTLMMKMPAIICDLALSFVVYRMAIKRTGNVMSTFLAALILFNPAVIVNSSSWGQIDSVFTFFILISLIKLYDGVEEKKPLYRDNVVWAAIFYAIAVLIKPQALIFGPVYLFFVIETKNWRVWVKSIVTGLLTIVVLSLPFSRGLDFTWLVERYLTTFASYPYVSVYAFNLYALFGQTWVPIETAKFAGISIEVISWFFIGLTIVYAGVLYFKSKEKSKLTFLAFLITAGLFTLGAKMHERYFFPGLIFLLVTYVLQRDKRLLYTFVGYSAVHFYNVAYVLQAVDKGFDPYDGYIITGSIMMLALFAYSIYLSIDIYWKGHTVQDLMEAKKIGSPQKQVAVKHTAPKKKFHYQVSEKLPKWNRVDVIILASIVLVYSLLSFYRLGSHTTALTSWQPAELEQSVTLDMGQERVCDTMVYIAGIGKQEFQGDFRTGVDFQVQVSNDGQTWTDAGHITEGYVFEWKITSIALEGRYIRLVPNTTSMALNEIAFFDAQTGEQVPLSLVDASAGYREENNPAHLIDEQDVVPAKPTYFDGTYFDEIYHARTAYEQLNFEEAYESTHPPLGKIIISIGISLFGMNPFGWRVMGVLFGILMLPIFYLLVKKMFSSSFLAGVGTFLFAFDFMHYTQSRIATIDTYAVFFLLLMYYFMYQYLTKSFYDTKLSKTLIPLGLCGLFTAMGVASKWTVAYGVIGIAVLFFISLGRRYVEYCYAKKQVEAKKATEFDQMVVSVFWKKAGITLACCVGFFLVVPAVVYVLSYIPYFMSGHSLKDLGPYIINMYNYHAGLVDTHSFSSVWWQWPIIERPIWYFSSNPLSMDGNQVISIAAFGNPAIWWTSIVTMVATLVIGLKKKDKKAAFIVIGYASVYLTQALVPRLLFIYHYYTAVPFLVLSIVYIMRNIKNRKIIYAYCGICLALFCLFFPVLSGMPTTQEYIDTYLRWFSSWYF